MHEIPFYVAANLTHAPELRQTMSGKAVATVSLAVNSRRRNGAGEWVNEEPTFFNATVWNKQAKHAAASLGVGDRVLVLGRLTTRSYTPAVGPRAGQITRYFEVVVDEIGPSLAFAEASVVRTSGDQVTGDDAAHEEVEVV